MLKLILGFILSLGVGGAILFESHWWQEYEQHHHKPTTGHTVATPEIDPAGTLSGLTLLAGGLMVLRGRRSAQRG